MRNIKDIFQLLGYINQNYVESGICLLQGLGYVPLAQIYSRFGAFDSYLGGYSAFQCPLVLEGLSNFYGFKPDSIGLYKLVSGNGLSESPKGQEVQMLRRV